MSEQRLMEEVLEGIRLLRASDTETKVKLAEVLGQLQRINEMRADFEVSERKVFEHEGRIKVLEDQNLDGRLKKVETLTFRIIAGALMLVGGMQLAGNAVELIRRLGL